MYKYKWCEKCIVIHHLKTAGPIWLSLLINVHKNVSTQKKGSPPLAHILIFHHNFRFIFFT